MIGRYLISHRLFLDKNKGVFIMSSFVGLYDPLFPSGVLKKAWTVLMPTAVSHEPEDNKVVLAARVICQDIADGGSCDDEINKFLELSGLSREQFDRMSRVLIRVPILLDQNQDLETLFRGCTGFIPAAVGECWDTDNTEMDNWLREFLQSDPVPTEEEFFAMMDGKMLVDDYAVSEKKGREALLMS